MFNLDRGFLHTLIRLTVAPGEVIRGYISGRTIVYTHPVVYLALAFAAFALLVSLTGGQAGSGDRLFFGLVVFCVAGVSRLVFWRSGLNYAEHLVLSFFLFAQVVHLFNLAQLVVVAVSSIGTAAASAAWVGACGYFAWAYSRIFPEHRWRSAFGGALVLLVGVVAWAGALAGALALFRVV